VTSSIRSVSPMESGAATRVDLGDFATCFGWQRSGKRAGKPGTISPDKLNPKSLDLNRTWTPVRRRQSWKETA
jgi:hypothetical protein